MSWTLSGAIYSPLPKVLTTIWLNSCDGQCFFKGFSRTVKKVPKNFAALTGGDFFNISRKIHRNNVFWCVARRRRKILSISRHINEILSFWERNPNTNFDFFIGLHFFSNSAPIIFSFLIGIYLLLPRRGFLCREASKIRCVYVRFLSRFVPFCYDLMIFVPICHIPIQKYFEISCQINNWTILKGFWIVTSLYVW